MLILGEKMEMVSKQKIKEVFKKYIIDFESSPFDHDFDYEGVLEELGVDSDEL